VQQTPSSGIIESFYDHTGPPVGQGEVRKQHSSLHLGQTPLRAPRFLNEPPASQVFSGIVQFLQCNRCRIDSNSSAIS